jgi:hypothetical protein
VSGVTPRPLSRVLVELAATAGARVSLDKLVTALSDRGFAPLIILLAAPNLLPLPPGSSTVFGIPLILLASQLLIARPRVWLPRLIRERWLDRETFTSIATRLERLLQRFKKLAKPRYWPMPQAAAERFVGLVVLAKALVLVAPIPFANEPPAFAIILVSLGLTQRDGLWLAGGTLVAAACLALVAGILGPTGFAALGLTKMTSGRCVPTAVDQNDAWFTSLRATAAPAAPASTPDWSYP